MSHQLADYRFELPQELIASRPAERRRDARMMVVNRAARTWEHRQFTDFAGYVRDGDLVVLNNSRVIRARLFPERPVEEILLLEPLGGTRWRCMVRPGKRMRLGDSCRVAGTVARVVEVESTGERVVEFSAAPDLGAYGELPLPPYMERRADAMDDERYQTVYATEEGSVAAPTAGLHFDAELLASVPHTFVTLHVGAGTFRPVQVADVREHRMHTERFVVSEETAARVEAARRVIAVGTTTVRVLESVADGWGRVPAGAGETNIFIRPPHEFRVVDALLTNFHFPESTLLMLVSAFADRELMLAAYEDAVRERYRFFSYGDCMLIL